MRLLRSPGRTPATRLLRYGLAALLCACALACTAGFALAAPAPSPPGGVQPGLVGPSPAPTGSAGNSTPSSPAPNGSSPTPIPDRPGQGFDSLMPEPSNDKNANPKLLFEEYPVLDYTPVYTDPSQLASDNGLLNPASYSQTAMNMAFNEGASGVTGLLVGMGALTTRIIEWTFSNDLVAAISEPINRVTGYLNAQFYGPLVGAVIAICGLWIIWQAWAHRHTRALEGFVWMLVALTIVAIFFGYPRSDPANPNTGGPAGAMSAMNNFTVDVSKVLLATVAAGDPGTAQDGKRLIPQGTTPSPATADAELRLFSDRYWSTFVFQPWCAIMFGQSDNTGQELGKKYLAAKESGNWSDFNSALEAANTQSNIATNSHNNSVKQWYIGGYGSDRLWTAMLAVLVATLSMLLYLLVALAVIVAQIALVALIMVAPIFAVLAPHPTTGRHLFTRWFELVLGALIVRIFYSFFLSILTVLAGAISSYASQWSWGLAAILQIALVVAAFIYRRPLAAIFSQATRIRFHHMGDHVTQGAVAERVDQQLQRRRTAILAGAQASNGTGTLRRHGSGAYQRYVRMGDDEGPGGSGPGGGGGPGTGGGRRGGPGGPGGGPGGGGVAGGGGGAAGDDAVAAAGAPGGSGGGSRLRPGLPARAVGSALRSSGGGRTARSTAARALEGGSGAARAAGAAEAGGTAGASGAAGSGAAAAGSAAGGASAAGGTAGAAGASGAAGAAGATGAAAAGAATGGLALAAIAGGQKAIRQGVRGTRWMQSRADHFILPDPDRPPRLSSPPKTAEQEVGRRRAWRQRTVELQWDHRGHPMRPAGPPGRHDWDGA